MSVWALIMPASFTHAAPAPEKASTAPAQRQLSNVLTVAELAMSLFRIRKGERVRKDKTVKRDEKIKKFSHASLQLTFLLKNLFSRT